MSPFEKVILCDGRVTLYCGDSLELLQAGELNFDAIVSDPPYGIGFQHNGCGKNKRMPACARTEKIHGDDVPFDPAPWTAACGDKKSIVLFGADHYKTRLPEGGRFICWDKSCGQGPAASFSDAEFAWTNRRNPRSIFRHFWAGALRADDGFDSKTAKRAHVSQKPVNLMAWCIEHARIGLDKVVLDPFMGSGSTGVAALMSGRKFVGVEIDPAHFEVARQRIEKAWAMMRTEGAVA
ncbi:MAG: hypothetical protein B7X60_01290 [Polynucleobacter sp. 39-45-136]|nr:MAG: hypothetical protein B7X60_01290 [Polynucleobacter sp. 39-45-136]